MSSSQNQRRPFASAADHGKEDEVEDYARKVKDLDIQIDGFMSRPELLRSPEEVRKEYWKKRNALYSQRKYYRKKLKIKELENRRDGLVARNAQVRQQNYVFEQMLSCANEQVRIIQLIERNVNVARQREMEDRLAAIARLQQANSSALTASLPSPQKNPHEALQDLLRSRATFPPANDVASLLREAVAAPGTSSSTEWLTPRRLSAANAASGHSGVDALLRLQQALNSERRASLPIAPQQFRSSSYPNLNQDDLERLLLLSQSAIGTADHDGNARNALLLAQQRAAAFLDEQDRKLPPSNYRR